MRINEFMASNKSGLKDSFGEYSDWIEIYNDGNETVNLKDFGLTDKEDKPFKWRFPDTNLFAKSYLIVFASSSNWRIPGQELHCGFKLSADGEYLGLCNKNGDVISSFAPAFPPQLVDTSYGWCSEAETKETTLLDETNPCSVCVPGNGAIDSVWYLKDFNDAGWLKGAGGVGFECNKGSNYDFSKYIKVDIKEAMYNQRSAAFVRYPFVLEGTPKLYSLTLKMRYADSFEAYLNGVMIAREEKMSGSGADAFSQGDRAKKDAITWRKFDITKYRSLLTAGTNVLAIVGTTAKISDKEFLISPMLTGGEVVSFTNEVMKYMKPASPGYPNRDGFSEILGSVTAVPEPGFYEEPFELRLRCATEGAWIVYTLDGTTPKIGGTIYRGHFTVDKTTIVRAIAFKDDAGGAEEFTGTFVFLNDIINSPDGVPPGSLWPTNSVNNQRLDYGMDTRITQAPEYKDAMLPGLKQLPFISIVASPANLFNASSGIYVNAKQDGKPWERQAHIELLNHDGSPGFSVGCGLRIRGSSSRAANNPKHSLRLFFRNEWGAGKLKFPLFGETEIDEFDKIDLRSTQTFSWHFEGDAYQSTYCRDEFVRDLALSMGMPGTRGCYYHVLLNGHYWGLYQTEERPDQNYAAHYFGGSEDDYDVLKPEDLVVTVTQGSMDGYKRLWQAATNGFSDASYLKTVNAGLLDPTNVADMAILNSLVCNMDSPVAVDNQHVNNFFALYNRINPGGFKFINHDSECSLLKEYYDADLTKDTPVGSKLNLFNSRYLHQRLMKSGEYRKLFVSRICKHYFNGGAALPEHMQELFMKRADSIYDAIVCESARWGDIRAPYGDRLPLRRDRDWQPNVNYIRDKFLPHRYEVTIEQYRAAGWFPKFDPPLLSPCGGQVPYGTKLTLSGAKKIVYTTDGSDPWGSKTAKTYAEPIVLTNSLTFRCCYAKTEIDLPMRGEADFTVEEAPEPAFGFLLLLFLLGKRRTVNV
ncbi:CotH kinase family protein [bacterium]|nr:CotH kinase family protein [bacterium]